MAKVTDIDSGNKGKQLTSTSRQNQKLRASPNADRDREYWAKASEAYELRVAGKQLSEIAEIMGLPSYDEVRRLLEERYAYDAAYLSDQERRSLLALEVMRLDKLQDALWPAAMMGDPKSCDSVTKIVATRARICGLDQTDPVTQKNLVLVVGEKEEDYLKALRAVSSD